MVTGSAANSSEPLKKRDGYDTPWKSTGPVLSVCSPASVPEALKNNPAVTGVAVIGKLPESPRRKATVRFLASKLKSGTSAPTTNSETPLTVRLIGGMASLRIVVDH